MVTATATATPAPTPTSTPVTWVTQYVSHDGARFSIRVPGEWSGGWVSFSANHHSGSPIQWTSENTIVGATTYGLTSLKEVGGSLIGATFKEEYWDRSDGVCGENPVVRETAVAVHFPDVGVALHVDVCKNRLTEIANVQIANAGLTNEQVSRQIIISLRLE